MTSTTRKHLCFLKYNLRNVYNHASSWLQKLRLSLFGSVVWQKWLILNMISANYEINVLTTIEKKAFKLIKFNNG